MSTPHDFFMNRALQIANNGLGTSRPNPSVGAVITINDTIIAEGFTAAYGGNHAEVNAIQSVKDKSILNEATIYVTLEPCVHFGKTPPCADLIVKYNLKEVVIGCVDSNSLVAGKGIERLQNAGIKVTVGVLEKECKIHHKRFFTAQEKKRPYIILKWAVTKDGFLYPDFKMLQKDSLQKEQHKAPVWISNTYSQQLVHKLRAKEHAILVGTNTVLTDNPKLNVRSWFGENPVRVVLDSSSRIPKTSFVLDGSVATILITDRKKEAKAKEQVFNTIAKKVTVEVIDFSENVALQICEVLQKHQIQSLIVEGGAQTLHTFIEENLWDEAMVFEGNTKFLNGIKAPVLNKQYTAKNIQEDILKQYTND